MKGLSDFQWHFQLQYSDSVCPLFIFSSGVDPLFILPGNSSLSDSLSSPVLTNVPSRAPVSAPALTEAFHPHGELCRSEEETDVRNKGACTFRRCLTGFKLLTCNASQLFGSHTSHLDQTRPQKWSKQRVFCFVFPGNPHPARSLLGWVCSSCLKVVTAPSPLLTLARRRDSGCHPLAHPDRGHLFNNLFYNVEKEVGVGGWRGKGGMSQCPCPPQNNRPQVVGFAGKAQGSDSKIHTETNENQLELRWAEATEENSASRLFYVCFFVPNANHGWTQRNVLSLDEFPNMVGRTESRKQLSQWGEFSIYRQAWG